MTDRSRRITSGALALLAAFAVGWLIAKSLTAPTSASVRIAAPHDAFVGDPIPLDATNSFSVWDMHLHVDPTARIGAWQVRLALEDAEVAGLEGGAPPFAAPPRYDPSALATGTLVIASIAPTPHHMAPPRVEATGDHHVATLHLHASGDAAASATLTVEAVAAIDGTPLVARASLIRRTRP